MLLILIQYKFIACVKISKMNACKENIAGQVIVGDMTIEYTQVNKNNHINLRQIKFCFIIL